MTKGTKWNEREAFIGQIADIIHRWWPVNYPCQGSSLESAEEVEAQARRVNSRDGWAFEYAQPHQDGLRQWTRVEGVVLSESELIRALAIAAQAREETTTELKGRYQ